jgi:hypothetical protein
MLGNISSLTSCQDTGPLVKWYDFLFLSDDGDYLCNVWNNIAKDRLTHGTMLIPVIAGSDKTTVSVTTGHQECNPVYASPGNISNTAQCGHGNAVMPVAFLLIPKSMYLLY